MNFEEKIRDCRYNLSQINHYNPDPYYVGYFFEAYVKSVIDIYDEIFEGANRDFGLFVFGKCTAEKFEGKALEKNDQNALRLVSWFKDSFEKEHTSPYPNFIQNAMHFFKKHGHLPDVTIKIRARQRYKDDVFQSIQVGLASGKIRSKEELQIEIKRQIPVFLEIINLKRKNNNESKVSENQIVASAFLEMENYEDIEIAYACEVYLPVLERLFGESMDEINRLSRWNG